MLTQLKLVATAIAAVTILGKRLSVRAWISIFSLIVGVSIVQAFSAHEASKQAAAATADLASMADIGVEHAVQATSTVHLTRSQFSLAFGTLLMIGASACSGLAGVLIEALLKGVNNNMWTTNAHLAFFSLLSALTPVLADLLVNGQTDPLRHFSILVWSLILLNVGGGVMMAMVLKYADNISKNFAVAISLVGTVLLSSFVSGTTIHVPQVIGTAIVVASTVSYGLG